MEAWQRCQMWEVRQPMPGITMSGNVTNYLFPIQTNTPGIVKTKEKRDFNAISSTNMAIASMVFSSSEHVFPQSAFIATLEGPVLTY